MKQTTRRNFVRLVGTAAVGTAAASGAMAAETNAESEWRAVESPTTKTLYAVVDTVAGPFAVGAGGDVLARRKSGWQKVVEYGPQARSRLLTDVDVTDDGKSIWFVGGSGVIGEYNVVTETLTDYSAPNGKTSTWEGCTVQGRTETDERFYFVNGSGELLIGVRQDSGAVKYHDVLKPGGGSTIPGIDCYARKNGHVCSTSQFVAEATDGGNEWQRIGIDFAGTNFFGIASVGPGDVNIAGGNGIIYRYDGFRWTPHVVDDARQAIRAIDRDGDRGLAAGGGGKIYERQSAGQWRRYQTPVETKFRGVAYGTHGVDVAVGNGGTIVERVTDESTDGDSGGANTTSGDANTTTSSTQNGSAASVSELSAVSDEPIRVRSYRRGRWLGLDRSQLANTSGRS